MEDGVCACDVLAGEGGVLVEVRGENHRLKARRLKPVETGWDKPLAGKRWNGGDDGARLADLALPRLNLSENRTNRRNGLWER